MRFCLKYAPSFHYNLLANNAGRLFNSPSPPSIAKQTLDQITIDIISFALNTLVVTSGTLLTHVLPSESSILKVPTDFVIQCDEYKQLNGPVYPSPIKAFTSSTLTTEGLLVTRM